MWHLILHKLQLHQLNKLITSNMFHICLSTFPMLMNKLTLPKSTYIILFFFFSSFSYFVVWIPYSSLVSSFILSHTYQSLIGPPDPIPLSLCTTFCIYFDVPFLLYHVIRYSVFALSRH